METKAYNAAAQGFILGKHREIGDPVGELTSREAKYLLLSGQIAAQSAAPVAEPDAPKRSGKGAADAAPKVGD